MATSGISARITLDGADQIKQQLADLGNSGSKALAQIKAAGQQVNLDAASKSAQALSTSLQKAGSVGADAGKQISDSFQQAGGQLRASNDASGSWGSGFLTAAERVSGAIAGLLIAANAAMAALVATGANAAQKLQDAADKAGLTTDQYQKLKAQIEAAGGDIDKVTTGLDKLGDSALQAAAKVKTTGLEIISIGKANGFGQQLAKQADTVQSFGKALDGSSVSVTRFASGMSIFGRSLDGSTTSLQTMKTRLSDIGAAAKGSASGFNDASNVLRQLGINLQSFATSDDQQKIDILRAAVQRIGDTAAQQLVAVKLFGDNWRGALAVLRQAPADAKAASDALIANGRFLTTAEIKNLTDYKTAQTDLGAALDATRNKIAAVLAPQQTATLTWVTNLIDQNRQWLVELAKTKLAQIDTFLDARFGSPQNALLAMFQSLKSFASDFVSVIKTLVIPAIVGIDAAFEFVAGKINGLLGSNISGRFLEIAVAVGVVTGAFGLLELVASPIVAVVGAIVAALGGLGGVLLEAGVGARAFSTEFEEGGVGASKAIEAEIPALRKAFQLFFARDLAGAWAIVKAEGVAAWKSVETAISDAKTPVGNFFSTVKSVFASIDEGLGVIASLLNAVFGTKLTSSSLLFYGVLLQLTGVFGTFLPALAAIATLLSRVGGGFLIMAAAGLILYRIASQLGQAWTDVKTAFSDLLKGDFAGAVQSLGAAFSQLWDQLKSQGALTWTILGVGALVFANGVVGVFARLSSSALWAPMVAASRVAWAAIVAIAGLAADAIALLFTPAGLIAAAIIGLGVVFFVFWDDIKAYAIKAWQAIADFAKTLWTGIEADAKAVWDTVEASAKAMWDGVVQYFSDKWNALKGVFTFGGDAAKPLKESADAASQSFHGLTADMQQANRSLTDLSAGAKSFAQTTAANVDAAARVFGDLPQAAKNAFGDLSAASSVAAKESTQPFIDQFSFAFGSAAKSAQTATSAISQKAAQIGNSFSLGFGGAKNALGGFFNLFQTSAGSAGNEATRAGASVESGIGGAFDSLRSRVASFWSQFAGSANQGSAAAARAVHESLGSVTLDLQTVTNAAGTFVESTNQTGLKIVSAVQPAKSGLDQVKSAAEALPNALDQIDFSKISSGAQGALDHVQQNVAQVGTELGKLSIPTDLETQAQDVTSKIVAAFQSIPSAIADVFAQLPGAVASATAEIVSLVEDMAASVSETIAGLIAQFADLANAATAATFGGGSSSGSSDSGGGSSDVLSLASGGPVSGAGSGTSDSIWARLSNGEFVVRAAAVEHYGPALLRALNAMRLPREAFAKLSLPSLTDLRASLDGLPAFAAGGLVSSLSIAPAFAGMALPAAAGPGIGNLAPVTIQLGGGQEISGLLAPPDVLGTLAKAASSQKLRRAGRAPVWKGA